MLVVGGGWCCSELTSDTLLLVVVWSGVLVLSHLLSRMCLVPLVPLFLPHSFYPTLSTYSSSRLFSEDGARPQRPPKEEPRVLFCHGGVDAGRKRVGGCVGRQTIVSNARRTPVFAGI